MDKIICDVCGTSYAENTSQCPICGLARPSKPKAAPSAESDSGSYTYVKGGRFSSGNVRKRNSDRGITPEPEDSWEDGGNGFDKGRLGGTVAIIALFTVVAILLFFIIKVALDRNKPFDEPTVTTSAQVSDNGPVGCTSLHADKGDIVFNAAGEKWQIAVTPEPANATDPISYTSMDPQIAAVDSEGLVTALSYGQTAIVVKCGEGNLVITVKCAFNDGSGEQWSLNRTEFTLSAEGATWDLYSKTSTVPINKIKWYSEDTEVATVENGVVSAVGPGSTTIHAEYNDTVYSCTVHCNVKVDDDQQDEDKQEGQEQDKDEDKDNTDAVDPNIDLATLKISHTDVSIKVGEAFKLTLKDASGKEATVTWTVSRPGYVTINGNTIRGQYTTGNDFVTVRTTYGGKTYECIVRVK